MDQLSAKLRIRELRENSRLTQREVAAHLGLRQQTYSRYETGTLIPSLKAIAALAELYDVSVDFLIGITNVTKHK